jgi:hypothetical protein
VCITSISKPDSLFNAGKNAALVWMDLLLDNKEKYSLLFKVSAGKAELLAYPAQSSYPVVKVVSSPVQSIHSQKIYHLNFSINIPGKGEFEISPRLTDQEVQMKKSSFWMGAVEVREKYTKAIKGVGNMYNFSNTITVE